MERISHRLIMLKPMRAGADGYARLQSEGGRTLLQIHARGLSAAAMHAYWYAGGGEARALGTARVNERGEAALTAEAPEDGLAPERLRALILLSGGEKPAPLLIGLCAQQSAGSLLDAKNAALALCERLSRGRRSRAQRETAFPTPQVTAQAARAQAAPEGPEEKPAPEKVAPVETPPVETAPPRPAPSQPEAEPLPREIFLPAIDPLPYITAQSRPVGDEGEPAAPATGQDGAEPGMEALLRPTVLRRDAPAVNRLRPLAWPRGFERLAGYFARGMPCRLFDLPGWRFVNAARAGGPQGLWVGVQRQAGRVSGVAYAHRGQTPPPGGRPYRAARGLDGETYQVLWQRIR